MIKVLVCEDQTLVRQGLAMILTLEPGIEVVGEAVNGEMAVQLAGSLRPDVALMDVLMPIMDGVEATRMITSRNLQTRVIILTTYDTEQYVFEGIKAGAMAYLLKDAPAPELVDTIRRVCAGERLIQPAVANKILFEFANPASPGCAKAWSKPAYEPLNEREVEIIDRLAQGMTHRQIANDLALAEGTVRNYASSILAKLHAANRVEAINAARRRKII
jgi:two-component system, NarL family, response regulator DegU